METLKTAYGIVNAYLNNIFTAGGIIVHISFVDKRNKMHIVIMQRSFSGEWEFDNREKYPEWILSLENEFERLIVKNHLRGFRQPPIATTE